eukprot:scaffold723_cov333-Pavlova_lutheri.AAC.6
MVYLSHRLSLAVGIGTTGVSWQPTCSLELHLPVRCVRPRANVSWQSHRHRLACYKASVEDVGHTVGTWDP